jgi:hypothetical protein
MALLLPDDGDGDGDGNGNGNGNGNGDGNDLAMLLPESNPLIPASIRTSFALDPLPPPYNLPHFRC